MDSHLLSVLRIHQSTIFGIVIHPKGGEQHISAASLQMTIPHSLVELNLITGQYTHSGARDVRRVKQTPPKLVKWDLQLGPHRFWGRQYGIPRDHQELLPVCNNRRWVVPATGTLLHWWHACFGGHLPGRGCRFDVKSELE